MNTVHDCTEAEMAPFSIENDNDFGGWAIIFEGDCIAISFCPFCGERL